MKQKKTIAQRVLPSIRKVNLKEVVVLASSNVELLSDVSDRVRKGDKSSVDVNQLSLF